MDRLKELEAKRRQLDELRAKRKQYDLLGQNSPTSREPKTIEMINVSIQTDNIGADTNEAVAAPQKDVITYDKAIQTVDFESMAVSVPENDNEGEGQEDENIIEEEEKMIPDEESNQSASFKGLMPLTIEGEANSILIKPLNIEKVHVSKSNVSGSIRKLTKIENDEISEVDAYCMTIDHNTTNNSSLLVYQIRGNVRTVNKSIVLVVDEDGNVIDKIEFLGQLVSFGYFLKFNITGNYMSMILVTLRGKTILYELYVNENGEWTRNLIIRNYFNSMVWGFHESEYRLIFGDIDGRLKILNSMDLSIYKDVTNLNYSNGIDSAVISVGKTRSENAIFNEQLKRSELLDFGLNVMCICLSPFNEDCLFIGCEDGGIYKVLLNDITSDNHLYVSNDNNGFLPPYEGGVEDEDNDGVLFHSGPVTTLSMKDNGLMISSGMDWRVKLWDTQTNLKLDEIDVGDPVIKSDWIKVPNKLMTISMTNDKILIIEWFFQKNNDTRLPTWERTTPVCHEIRWTIQPSDLDSNFKFTTFHSTTSLTPSTTFLNVQVGFHGNEIRTFEIPVM
ncbi:hypothetical protein KAFR_0G01280 [Kazachstania africana CBS 2517]|uniref:Uncharacterized protein n=1 Tax=Kazachstania africana (strain ATCC 22294 / BCRC 22015 / CBS 2517 / CECT 1963 / NBRC 1671 / NRRL Y-8276) TaxID=1071382 RepID=H2AXR2_KAZAF|nr:hypothetical protein KAFR_0G01280 [Kazachstania africana CBS 2517]CCF59162.1 hypothetical protein KAFR_0G01280 [Kazachstania africana CBS 2517]